MKIVVPLLIAIAASSGTSASGQDSKADQSAVFALEAMLKDGDFEARDDLPTDIVYCGGETTRAEVFRFFSHLSAGIKEGLPAPYFNQFVADRFSVNRDDRYMVFDREDFTSVTPRFFSREDWIRIADKGAPALEDMGWRGCMMDRGKIWFSADEKGLRISSINHDLPWLSPD